MYSCLFPVTLLLLLSPNFHQSHSLSSADDTTISNQFNDIVRNRNNGRSLDYDEPTGDESTDTTSNWSSRKLINDTVVNTIVRAIQRQKTSIIVPTTTDANTDQEDSESSGFESRKILVYSNNESTSTVLPSAENGSEILMNITKPTLELNETDSILNLITKPVLEKNITTELAELEESTERTIALDSDGVIDEKPLQSMNNSLNNTESFTEPYTSNIIENIHVNAKLKPENITTSSTFQTESNSVAPSAVDPETSPTPALISSEFVVTSQTPVVLESVVISSSFPSEDSITPTSSVPTDLEARQGSTVESVIIKSSMTESGSSESSVQSFNSQSDILSTPILLTKTTELLTSFTSVGDFPESDTVTVTHLYTNNYSDKIIPHSTKIRHEEFSIEVTTYDSQDDIDSEEHDVNSKISPTATVLHTEFVKSTKSYDSNGEQDGNYHEVEASLPYSYNSDFPGDGVSYHSSSVLYWHPRYGDSFEESSNPVDSNEYPTNSITPVQHSEDSFTSVTYSQSNNTRERTRENDDVGEPIVTTTMDSIPKLRVETIANMPWVEFCSHREMFEAIIMSMIGNKNRNEMSKYTVTLMNSENCMNNTIETFPVENEINTTATEMIEVMFYVSNGDQQLDVEQTLSVGKMWNDTAFNGTPFKDKFVKVGICGTQCEVVYSKYHSNSQAGTALDNSEYTFKVAIGVSSIAAVALILIAVLVVVMRQRHRRFKYARRCRPATLNTYGLDNLSVCGSLKRSKKLGRASKRSYANQAFEDPNAPSKSTPFATLANWSMDTASLEEEFTSIPTVTPTVDDLPPGAELRNRYSNVIPIPETRVRLGNKPSELEEYINANYVRGPKGIDKCYIACQGPLDGTVADFWQMVWEQQSKLIIMVTDLVENGVQKCAEYFPTSETLNSHQLYGDYQITLKKQDFKEHYIVSQLIVKDMERNLWREVIHLWFHIWPSKGVPSDPAPVVALLLHTRPLTKENSGPTIVHCSPGTGRTGTLLACDVGMRELDDQRIADVPNCVYRLRRDRAGAVQTKEQYVFIYKVLSCYAARLSGTAMDSI